jgi:hypothetical protein
MDYRPPIRFWAVGSAFAWPDFDGGRRAGLNRNAQASYDEMVANYRQALIDLTEKSRTTLPPSSRLRTTALPSFRGGACAACACADHEPLR